MKKIALTSLLAVFAAAGANAANVIDGNPLYMPKAGHFYSETALSSHSETIESWAVSEEFGYGISDKLAVSVKTDIFEMESFDAYGWGSLALNATFRAFDKGAWKVDAYAGYGINPSFGGERTGALILSDDVDTYWFEQDNTAYAWTLGVRGGYTTGDWTVAGHVAFNYMGTESFNWGDEGWHTWAFGVDGQYVIDSNWSLVAGLEYTAITDDGMGEDLGRWTGEFGVNYNIDATKYVGAYINAAMNHHEGDAHDSWGFEDGFGFGVKFGIDF
jgi:hypothetical protein